MQNMIRSLKPNVLAGLTASLLPAGLLAGLLAGCASSRAAEGGNPPVTTLGQGAATPAPLPGSSRKLADAHFHLVDFLQRTDGVRAVLAAMDAAGVTDTMLTGMPLVKKWSKEDARQPLYYLEDESPVYWYSATDVLVAREVLSAPEAERHRLHPFITGFNPTDRNAIDHV